MEEELSSIIFKSQNHGFVIWWSIFTRVLLSKTSLYFSYVSQSLLIPPVSKLIIKSGSNFLMSKSFSKI
ncbi:MAG: hypothetical protein LBC61_03375 [Candidatus Peribacteria bacterium]|nr:hypothetical protein [Candidatus Peribacteria bacterium]